jgi:signal transduction histidine kinase
MRLLAENLESGVVTEEARARNITASWPTNAADSATLVDNVLDFARIEQDRKTYHFSEADIVALVADTLRLLAPGRRAARAKIRQRSRAAHPALRWPFHPAGTRQPRRQRPEIFATNSTVTVRAAKRSAQEWELSVRDEGPGVPLHEREKIFERFYRVGSELTRETQGAGIGLSIVKHIAEGHGGPRHGDGTPRSPWCSRALPPSRQLKCPAS